MEKCHEEVLRMNTVYLTRNLDVKGVCYGLVERGLFDETSIDHLTNPFKCSKDRCMDLLFFLVRRGPLAWDYFIESLIENGQPHIADRLLKSLQLYRKNHKITAEDIRKFFQ